MKTFILALLFPLIVFGADKKISELNSLGHSSFATNDLLVIVDTSASETKNTTLGDFDFRYFLKGTDVLPIASGGTNLSSIPAAGSFIYSNGSAFLSLGSTCTAGQVLQVNGSHVWACATPATGGTVNTILVGTGMTGGGSSSTVTVGVNTELQGLSGLSSLGIVKRTGSGTYTAAAVDLTTDVTGTLPTSNLTQSTTSTDGYLSSTDWNTFNGKQSAITPGSISTSTTGVSVGSGSNSTVGPNVTVDVQTASGSQPGLLSSTDWNTFNNKGSGTVTSVTGTSPIVSSGGATPAISCSVASGSLAGCLSSTDWTTFNGKFTLPSLTSGSVVFSNGSTLVQDNTNFFFDSANHSLSVGPGPHPATSADLAISSQASDTKVGLSVFTTSSNNAVQISSQNAFSLQAFVASSANSPSINFERSRGTLVSKTQALAGDILGSFVFNGYTGSADGSFAAGFGAVATENQASGHAGAELLFQTTPNASTTLVTRMVINQNGTIQTPAYSTGYATFDSSGNITSSSATTVTAALNQFTSSLQGLVPSSGGGTTNFLRADGTWAAAGGGSGATTALDNLASTAVNADINPGTSNAFNLGTPTNEYAAVNAVFLQTSEIIDSTAVGGPSTYVDLGSNLTPVIDSTYTIGQSSRALSFVYSNNLYASNGNSLAIQSGTTVVSTGGSQLNMAAGDGDSTSPGYGGGAISETAGGSYGSATGGILALTGGPAYENGAGGNTIVSGGPSNSTSSVGGGSVSVLAGQDQSTPAVFGNVNFQGVNFQFSGAGVASTVVLSDTHLDSINSSWSAPTALVNANAGTGGSSSMSDNTDIAGNISLTTTNVASASGEQTQITFSEGFSSAPIIVITPTNAAAALASVSLGVYVTSSTTSFSINFANADVTGGTYTWAYHVISTY